jgi:hypothetical protein
MTQAGSAHARNAPDGVLARGGVERLDEAREVAPVRLRMGTTGTSGSVMRAQLEEQRTQNQKQETGGVAPRCMLCAPSNTLPRAAR